MPDLLLTGHMMVRNVLAAPQLRWPLQRRCRSGSEHKLRAASVLWLLARACRLWSGKANVWASHSWLLPAGSSCLLCRCLASAQCRFRALQSSRRQLQRLMAGNLCSINAAHVRPRLRLVRMHRGIATMGNASMPWRSGGALHRYSCMGYPTTQIMS